MKDPDWWPAWNAYTAVQREYEAAVEWLRTLDGDHAHLEMERIRKEIIPQRNAAFEAFRVKFGKRQRLSQQRKKGATYGAGKL